MSFIIVVLIQTLLERGSSELFIIINVIESDFDIDLIHESIVCIK